jgi:hypothetical protein
MAFLSQEKRRESEEWNPNGRGEERGEEGVAGGVVDLCRRA